VRVFVISPLLFFSLPRGREGEAVARTLVEVDKDERPRASPPFFLSSLAPLLPHAGLSGRRWPWRTREERDHHRGPLSFFFSSRGKKGGHPAGVVT